MELMAESLAVGTLTQDLRDIFGSRFVSLVVYRPATLTPPAVAHTMATVDSLTLDDLQACASRAASWHEHGLATPLIVETREFDRSLDAFPLEFGAILADHEVVVGPDPFGSLRVEAEDLRRACEVQVRSHLLHLREGFIETRGQTTALVALMVDSVGPLAGLLVSVARLLGHPTRHPDEAARLVERTAGLGAGSLGDVLTHAGGGDLGGAIARRLFPVYLDAVERLTQYVDRWSQT